MKAPRLFTPEDQKGFAAATGDINPIHMDPLAARKTQAGAPIVHGIHTLLWLIDVLARAQPSLPAFSSMKVRFAKMIYVGESVEAKITQQDDKGLRAEVLVGGTVALTLRATFGVAGPTPALIQEMNAATIFTPKAPQDLSIENMKNGAGRLTLPDPQKLAAMFPIAARFLGARRVAALGCSSYLVGMVVPGLHSIYSGLDCDLCEDKNPGEHAAFKVVSVDERFRMVQTDMAGGGVSLKIESFVRSSPVRQATIADIAAHVKRNEFAGSAVLIVGGSRGLGELTAKVIAAGGGEVVITYARGKTEAENLAAEITASGGTCRTLAYDVLKDPVQQLAVLQEVPRHIYYFATPPLMVRASPTFSQERYEAFAAYYVSGFERLMQAVTASRPGDIDVFYPSSIAIDEQPAGMIEYVAAKQAGEKLCADMEKHMPNVRIIVSRLPRLPTDLTATLQTVETAEPLAVMLPLIRDVQGRSAERQKRKNTVRRLR